ncbi:MAG: hypothetical protein AUK55_12880 [Syntrophobacteraceae bacterium CG2_30_61_12]|nr:MAG: hypothetical protein AUK55_12880 [Syntrophobacteraceae bacterium CG2_30_61_12]
MLIRLNPCVSSALLSGIRKAGMIDTAGHGLKFIWRRTGGLVVSRFAAGQHIRLIAWGEMATAGALSAEPRPRRGWVG